MQLERIVDAVLSCVLLLEVQAVHALLPVTALKVLIGHSVQLDDVSSMVPVHPASQSHVPRPVKGRLLFVDKVVACAGHAWQSPLPCPGLKKDALHGVHTFTVFGSVSVAMP